MLERYPDEAPPSLVIVVDEFATLVKEVPDFVAGVVDIAQRGRSLGVHLILATQRPSGSVNDNILANTNLRISLRMLDSIESKTIIGVGSAAEIPLPLKGRGFAKLGPRDLIEFQSAFTGAPLTQENEAIPVIVEQLRQHGAARGARRRPAAAARPTVAAQVDRRHDTGADADLQRSGDGRAGPARRPADAAAVEGRHVAATDRAAVRRHRPASAGRHAAPVAAPHQRRRREAFGRPTSTCSSTPCATRCRTCRRRASRGARCSPSCCRGTRSSCPPTRRERRGKGRYITLGMLDDPAAQAQYPAVFDLEEGGGLLIAGGGGSGKTTALRTVARAAVDGATPDEVALFVIDCASRSLGPLRDLPHCAAVATGDDLESITRVDRRAHRRARPSPARCCPTSTCRPRRCRRTSTRATRCRASSCSSTATRTSTRSSAPCSRWRPDRSTGSPSSIGSSPTGANSASTSSSPPTAARRCRR